ncbi:MAG: iron-sulfur cluster-binding domain-containing protein [Clostridia bacterium]|nr:iron-sulfur cluster-binding domain-containing protein [Clostridia bacterium]
MDNKPNLNSIKPAAFAGMMGRRLKAIATSSAAPVRDLYDYPANRLARELHPSKQYLRVAAIEAHSDDMKTYTLVPDKEKGTAALAWFSAGQYLVIALKVGGKACSRPYSISSSPAETLEGRYRLTIKRVADGTVSNHILDTWTVGTSVLASAPMGDFTYEPLRDAKTVVGVAGGSGITPFYAFAKAIAEGEEDFNLTILYGSRTLEDAVFSEEIKALAAACPRLRLVNVLSDVSKKPKDAEKGFITAALIKKYAPENEPYSVFLCGPQAMYNFVDKELEGLGLRRKFIRHELFGEYFHPENDAAYPENVAESFQLTVRIAGKSQTVACPRDTSLLRAMEAAGINAPADCRSGRCGWCHSQLISGEVFVPASVDGRRQADKLYGYIHPCCTFPLSDVVIDVPPLPYK